MSFNKLIELFSDSHARDSGVVAQRLTQVLKDDAKKDDIKAKTKKKSNNLFLTQ